MYIIHRIELHPSNSISLGYVPSSSPLSRGVVVDYQLLVAIAADRVVGGARVLVGHEVVEEGVSADEAALQVLVRKDGCKADAD